LLRLFIITNKQIAEVYNRNSFYRTLNPLKQSVNPSTMLYLRKFNCK